MERHGFNFIAVEADWPDAAALNRYVRHWPRGELVRTVFQVSKEKFKKALIRKA
jgi:erythromycin esterase-like protein